jgi:uncharacterized membrane protein/nitrite reductase/ring-hydroxylating ferredoxin subunit
MKNRRDFLKAAGGAVGILLVGFKSKKAAAQEMSLPLESVPALKTVGGSVRVEILGEEILLIRDSEATVRGVSGRCTHRRRKLRYNEQTRTLYCRCSGSSFDLDGNILGGRAKLPLRKFRTVLSNGRIILEKIGVSKPAVPMLTAIFWVCLVLPMVPHDAAAQTRSPVDGEVEPTANVVVFENVYPADVAEGADSNKHEYGVLQVIGRNHASSVHLAIGLLMGVAILELFALLCPNVALGKSRLVLSTATIMGFVPAILSGFLRADESYNIISVSSVHFLHRDLMVAACFLFAAAFVLRLWTKPHFDGILRRIHLGLLLLAVMLVIIGGHYGGQLAYGEDFLPY